MFAEAPALSDHQAQEAILRSGGVLLVEGKSVCPRASLSCALPEGEEFSGTVKLFQESRRLSNRAAAAGPASIAGQGRLSVGSSLERIAELFCQRASNGQVMWRRLLARFR